jgi:TP901 family phage tail tape measure protein
VADVNANIDVNINTSNALSQLKNLQSQISKFHSSIAKSSEAAALAQKSLQKNLLSSINSIGAFSAELRTVKTTAESFTTSLEKNKFSMREYFRYAGASTKSFGKVFKSEFDTIQKVAEDRVRKLQTQYIKLGRDSAGAMKAIAVIPDHLDLSSLSTQTQIAAQRQAIFNQLMKQGSTNLLNFGKNTQWAGRQLMVGFSLPLLSVGSMATKTFMDMETQALKFKKVYGDLFTTQSETQQQLDSIKELGKQFTKYGIAVSQTVGLAADAAAAGFQGLDLQRQTTEATRLSVLGQIDAQQALQTTISLQNAFGISSADLAGNIDFLNAVENQTVTSLDDITTAIPKVAPVIKQLGGNVKDLAFFLTAMKEGGVNASEGANALKSGLASLINPSAKASAMLASMGINIRNIVTQNKGNLRATVVEFAKALDKLDPLARARAIEQMFGKFQFARISTLFQNVTKSGTQAARVMDLANASATDLANLSQQELGITADSAMNKFKKSVEDLKLALVPVGETFLRAVTPIIDFVSGILDKFNGLSDGVKKFITIMTVGVAGIGPIVLMAFGLLANGIANIIKLFLTLRNGYLRLTGQSQVLGEQTRYLNSEQLDAAAAAHSLNQSHATLTQTFNVEKNALRQLISAYQAATRASETFAMNNPGMMLPGFKRKKMATGGVVVGPGNGTSDSVPAMLSNGEAVIPAKNVRKYPHLTAGLVAGNIPGFAGGMLPMFPEFALRLQTAAENIGHQGGKTGLANVLSPLALRIGEARGMAPTRSRVGKGDFDQIFNEFSGLTQQFVDKLNSEFETTFSDIQNTDERFAKAWTSAGKSVEASVNQIKSDADRGVLRKTFGLDEDTYATIPTAPRKAGGTVPERARQGAFLSKLFGTTSYTNIRPAAKDLFGRMTKTSGADLQMGHVFKPKMVDIEHLLSDPKRSSAVVRAAKVLGIKVGEAHNAGVKQVVKDPYVISRDRKSPHRLAPKDGADDARAYTDAEQKAIDKSIARHERKLAKRGIVAGGVSPKVSMLSRMRGIAGTAMGKLSNPKVGFGLSSALMMGSMLPGKAGEVAGQLSTVGFLVQALKLLPGPLKLVAGGLLATYGIIKLVNVFRDKERQAIEGLGNAAVVSGNKLKTLGDFFGVAPTKLPYESLGSAPVAMSKQQRSRVDELRANSGFKKDFGKDISALKKTNSSNAKMILESMGIQLNARGFAQDQIKTIIQALQIESGKTDITLDFKNIGVVNEKNIQGQATNISRKFSETFGKGMKKTLVEYTGPRSAPLIKVITEWTKSQKALMKGAAASMFGVYQGLIGQLQNGTIDATSFNKQISILNTQIQSMPKAVQLSLIREMFAKLGPDAIKATSGIKSARDQLAAFLALSYGTLSLDSSVLKVLNNPDKYDPKTIGRAQAQLQKAMKDGLDFQKQIAKMTQQENGTGGTGGGTGTGTTDVLSKEAKLTIARLKKELDALKTKRDIIKQTNDELMRQYDYQQKLTDLQQSALQAKAQGNYIQAAMLQQQQYHTTAQFNTETRNLQLDKKITELENRISGLTAGEKVTAAEKALLKAKSGLAFGGLVRGPGTAMSDSIKARVGYASGGMINLSNGEYVMREAAVRTYGTSFMNAVNNSKVGVSDSATNSGSVYNVTMTINGGNNNPNEIADQVIKKLNVMASRGNKTNKVGG